MTQPVNIRLLTKDDVAAFRDLRLEALSDTPRAFRETRAEAEALPLQNWQQRFDTDNIYFGGFVDDVLVGSVGLMPEGRSVVAHKAWLIGMYVSPRARGTGLGKALITDLLDYAKDKGFLQVHLGVGTFNAGARTLYERMGFAEYGVEPRGQIVDGEEIDEALMVRFLDRD